MKKDDAIGLLVLSFIVFWAAIFVYAIPYAMHKAQVERSERARIKYDLEVRLLKQQLKAINTTNNNRL